MKINCPHSDGNSCMQYNEMGQLCQDCPLVFPELLRRFVKACQRCKSTRLVDTLSHAADRHVVRIGTTEHCDYLPRDLGIGGGDDCEFSYCLDCGQIQGTFPLPKTKLEEQW